MKFWGGIFLLGAGLNILLGLHGWPAVLGGSLDDPDSYMRLERIRQGIAQGHLVNVVARDDAGAGVLVEWSRLLDALIWLMAAPLAVFAGWSRALFIAGVALGPLGVGALAAALAFVAEPFAARRFVWLVPVCAATLPALANYAAPGVVTHHVLLLALIALTAGFVFRSWEGDNGFAFMAGLAGGFAVWLTPETMPFVLLCFGALLLRWLERAIGPALAACGAGFFDVLGFGLMVDPPQGGYGIVEIDRLSVVYLALGAVVLLAGVCLWRLDARWPGLAWRRPAGLAVAILLMAAWIGAFPGVLLGPYGLLNAKQTRLFFGIITEMRPAGWDVNSFADLWPGVVAVGLAAWLWLPRRGWRGPYLLACLLLALALGVRYLRFAPVSAAAAAVLLPIALNRVSVRWLGRPGVAAGARLALVALLLVAPRLPAMAVGAWQKPAAGPAAPSCSLRRIAPLLRPAAGQVVLADVNATPELLWRTRILTVGSLYHHGIAGFLALRAAWRAAPGIAPPPAVAATGARYVLFCPGGGRTDLVADLPKTTLWDALAARQPPTWLTLVGQDAGTGWRLYRITP